jgi:hypothetical protein
MEIGIVERIADIPSKQFDLLDQSAGAASCYDRIRQKESDGRWRAIYLQCADNDCLTAAIPLYTCREREWPNPLYDPRTWELPQEVSENCTPGRYLLVGSYADLRSGLHVAHALRDSRHFRSILAAIARMAAEQDRGLIFPYVFTAAKTALTDAADGRIAWCLLGREARIRDVSDPAWESRLSRSVRYNLRHDKILIASAHLSRAECAWSDIEGTASELIANHNIRKGQPDHPEFVRMRNREWEECDAVELIVFTARSNLVSGVLTALVWNEDIELYEIGLDGEEGPDRRAAYLDLVFHQPISFAQSRKLRNIRLGPMAETPKAGRGAAFQDLYGGVLDTADTKRLAENFS